MSRRSLFESGPARLRAELVVDADAGDEEVVVVVVAPEQAEARAADRSAGVRHADDVVAEEAVVVVVVEVDPQAFELDRQVVGPGVLDTAAEHPADVVVVVAPEEPAGPDPRAERRRR